jgi:DNA mismatch repair ATPase MutL
MLVIDREIELFRLQIVTELIKMHITSGRKLSIAAAAVTAAAAAAAAAAVTESVAVTSSDMTSSSALPSTSSSSSSSSSSSDAVPSSNGKSEEPVKTLRRESQTSSTLDKKEGKKEGDKEKDKSKEKDKEKEGGNEKRGSMDVDTIEQHLDSSLQAVEAIAGTAVTSIFITVLLLPYLQLLPL